ncbi:Putative uncharacterized protein [Moritella viscosa]|nr:Putative uncharacterized protein [Moritella viscosa]SGY86358.1 Putative uncharacterized protein [Moritella viscosa]
MFFNYRCWLGGFDDELMSLIAIIETKKKAQWLPLLTNRHVSMIIR